MIGKITLIALGLSALWLLGTFWVQAQERKQSALAQQMIPVSSSKSKQIVQLSEIHSLPPPVKKYLHLVLKDGAPIIRSASLSQIGGFRVKPDKKGWSELQAKQRFSTHPPAFVWDASIEIVPGIMIRVRDSYRNGMGKMKVKLLSLLPLMSMQDERELNEAALQRYLAETVWFPTALLPSQGISWQPIGPNKASASITDAGITVSLEFEFNEQGEIISVFSPARYREVSGSYEPTPWKGYFSDYQNADGYLVPTAARVEWHLPDQTWPYWQAKLHNIHYQAD